MHDRDEALWSIVQDGMISRTTYLFCRPTNERHASIDPRGLGEILDQQPLYYTLMCPSTVFERVPGKQTSRDHESRMMEDAEAMITAICVFRPAYPSLTTGNCLLVLFASEPKTHASQENGKAYRLTAAATRDLIKGATGLSQSSLVTSNVKLLVIELYPLSCETDTLA